MSNFFKQLALKQAEKFERQTKARAKFEAEVNQIVSSGKATTRKQAVEQWLNKKR